MGQAQVQRDPPAQERGGDNQRVSLSEVVQGDANGEVDVELLLDELDDLSRLNHRHSEIVTLRFFGGLTVGEVAECLGVSKRTVESDWQMARAWLLSRLSA